MMYQELSEQNRLGEDHDPICSGMPIVVRTSTGSDILCTAWIPKVVDANSSEPMVVERPIEIFFETTFPDPDSNEVKSQIRFARWMPLSDATAFPLYVSHILSIAPLTGMITNAYIKWADTLYQRNTLQLKDASAAPDVAAEELLRAFDHVGKKVC